MDKQPKKRGAPPKENPASERFEVRCTPEQKSRWQQAADKAGFRSLGAWLKALADRHTQTKGKL